MAGSQKVSGSRAERHGDVAISIRALTSQKEFEEAVRLQREIWGFNDLELLPVRLFVVATKVGGQTLGAFDGSRMIGFCLAIPGLKPGGISYLHSHMLGVSHEYRDAGVGRLLKLKQREDALQRSIDLVEWTFDPLEIKNAHLNLVRLGAIARRYSVNHYGSSSSPLQGGLPTDRLVAEWWLKSRRVSNLLDRGQGPQFVIEKKISVPAEIYSWKASAAERSKAAEVQQRNREEFLSAFAQGLTALGYERDSAGNGAYLLGRWDENLSFGKADEVSE